LLCFVQIHYRKTVRINYRWQSSFDSSKFIYQNHLGQASSDLLILAGYADWSVAFFVAMPEGESLLTSSREFLERAVSLSSKEFVRGFIIGQVALLLVLIVLARVLFFRGPAPGNGQIRFKRKDSTRKRKMESVALETLADRLGLDTKTLPKRESCLWANSLAGRLLLEPIRETLLDGDTLGYISALLNAHVKKTEMLGPIEIHRFELSENSPLIRWVEAVEDDVWEVRVEWNELATLELDTSVILNWPPRQQIATLPCTFSFSVRALETTLRMEISTGHIVCLSVLPEDFLLDLEIHSLVGHRSKLKDVPKLTAILYGRIKDAIKERVLYPKQIQIAAGDLIQKAFRRNSPIKTVD
jgi:maintenance of morphology protein 1